MVDKTKTIRGHGKARGFEVRPTKRSRYSKEVEDWFINERIPAVPDVPVGYPEGFTTDGCSGAMSWFCRKILGHPPPWENCCIEHDLAYWRGGYWKDRWDADAQLYICVREGGHPVWAALIWIGVRIGGPPFFPTPWRWGYGWEYTGTYES